MAVISNWEYTHSEERVAKEAAENQEQIYAV